MNRLHTISQALPRRQWLRAAAGAAVLGTVPVWAQRSPGFGTYQPEPFQAGKDVVWVPTPQPLVDNMLDMAGVTTDDYLIDLGSGDGRTVITAAKRGAVSRGIEFNPDLVALSKRNAAADLAPENRSA